MDMIHTGAKITAALNECHAQSDGHYRSRGKFTRCAAVRVGCFTTDALTTICDE
jgi:hypothetical protein